MVGFNLVQVHCCKCILIYNTVSTLECTLFLSSGPFCIDSFKIIKYTLRFYIYSSIIIIMLMRGKLKHFLAI